MANERPFLILIVLDGFGCRKEKEWNAIATAETPAFDRLFHDSPWTTLEASGLAVGLPPGQMGNSEVGHLNIGAGRVVYQDVVRISKAIEEGDLDKNEVFSSMIRRLGERARSAARPPAMHFAGLLSPGGVHSLQTHLYGLIDAAIRLGAPQVFVHAILDGRDTPPKSADKYIRELLEFLSTRPKAQLATVVGRYYTMDRDKRWERVQRGYDLMTLGVGTETKDPVATVERFYEQNITDEFMEPISVLSADGSHRGRVEDGDALLFFNFRADRMRQIVTALKDDDFSGFDRAVRPKIDLVTMNSYREDWTLPVVFAPQAIRNNLGETLSKAGLRQLRIAETEKYAHVTFFFNGGSDTQFPGEQRILVQSPKIATYDLEPAMSVVELTDKVVGAIESHDFDAIIMNIANPDMVGHTGVMKAAVEAVHDTDTAIGRILEAVDKVGGITLITADHGNCELMFDPATGQPHTAHTTNPVPFILADSRKRYAGFSGKGALENVAPTILDILEIEQPKEMTAASLLARKPAAVAR